GALTFMAVRPALCNIVRLWGVAGSYIFLQPEHIEVATRPHNHSPAIGLREANGPPGAVRPEWRFSERSQRLRPDRHKPWKAGASKPSDRRTSQSSAKRHLRPQ